MNDKVNKIKKLNHFKNFRINKKLMNYAKKDCIFLHCLLEGQKLMKKYFQVNNQRFGHKLLIGSMFKEYFIILFWKIKVKVKDYLNSDLDIKLLMPCLFLFSIQQKPF